MDVGWNKLKAGAGAGKGAGVAEAGSANARLEAEERRKYKEDFGEEMSKNDAGKKRIDKAGAEPCPLCPEAKGKPEQVRLVSRS